MKLVGITGNIGSGKSTVCGLFSKLGIPVFDSDSCAKHQYNKQPVKDKLVDVCGPHIIKAGSVDFDILKKFAFASKENANLLTDIISQPLFEDFNLFAYHSGGYAPFILFESAILLKRNLQSRFDYVIGVYADRQTRYQRVSVRNGFTYEQFIERDILQSTDEELLNQSHFVINNSDGYEKSPLSLTKQVENVYLDLNNR